MKKRLKDAIYGFIIGDALGVPYEFRIRDTFKCSTMIGYGTWPKPAGTWSDDSSMLLATCKSIKDNKGKINLDDIFNNFKLWYYNSYFTTDNDVFDIGRTTHLAITKNIPGTSSTSNGNGSLMRILPLAFIKVTSINIDDVSSLTHAHSVSKKACNIYVNIIKGLLKNKSLISILKKIKFDSPFERLNIIDTLKIDEIKSSGYVVDTLEASIWCIINSTSYQEAVLKAVNLGGDTDTIAAITGGLAGVIYGYDSIPNEWINCLLNKELIDKCLF